MEREPVRHPHQQPQMRTPHQEEKDGGRLICVETCEGLFPEIDPFLYPPGANLLPTVYTDVFDGRNPPQPIPNTLPSTPRKPYNLHDCDPVVTELTDEQKKSPTDDLYELLNDLPLLLTGNSYREHWAHHGDCTKPDDFGSPLPGAQIDASAVAEKLQLAIAILQGDQLQGDPYQHRVYGNGKFPLLHYNGGEKLKQVKQVTLDDGRTIWNVDVHQIWYDSHIESDTAFIDLSPLNGPDGKVSDTVEWMITYTIDVLSRGKDDFSPMTMYFDHPDHQEEPLDCKGEPIKPLADRADKFGGQQQYRIKEGEPPPLPGVAMDQTFLPVHDGTHTIVRIKMAPPRYYNLTYTWGWRQHPPRVQVIENANKRFPPDDPKSPTLYEHESGVFGAQRDLQKVRDKISDWDPAKRMWMAFSAALATVESAVPDYDACLRQVKEAWCSFQDWKDRNHLPRLPDGYGVDPDSDLTLLYVNNTIYGQMSDGGLHDLPKWRTRGAQLRVKLINADYYQRGYINMDFGGARGWENQFKSSLKVGGSGCQFSFGRFYWSMNIAKPVMLDPAHRVSGQTVPDEKRVHITFNFEPSRRLRFYQFDPLHHDVAVYSIH